MILRNTSIYPIQDVRSLVAFAVQDVDMRNVCVNIKNHNRGGYGFRGRAYRGVPVMSNAPPSTKYLVTIGIGPASDFPRGPIQHRKRTEPQTFADWREALVYVAAHEAKHIEQFRERLSISEIRCEAFAAHMLGRFRINSAV